MYLFADDTSLTVCGKDLDSLIHHINIELPKIYDWLCANKLTLNLTKTKYIILQPRQKLNSNLHLPIHLIPKWLPINYSFVCMFISPLCFVSMYKTQKNFEVKMRQRGLINMQAKE